MNYSPYGFAPHVAQGAITLSFNGEHLDRPTERYFLGNGHRGFSPTIMRFCSPDARSPFLQGGLNCYCYCSGEPINFLDASGQMRTPLKRLNSNRPLSHSGNPRPSQSADLLRRAETHYHRAQDARALAMDASEASRHYDQAANQARRSARMSTNRHSRNERLRAAHQYTEQAINHMDVSEQHLYIESLELDNMHQANTENRNLQKNHKENFPPSPTSATQSQPIQENITFATQNRGVMIRQFPER